MPNMGCVVETPEQDCRPEILSASRPYAELSPEAQQRVREVWREKGWTWDEHDSEDLTEFFRQELECAYGIDDAKVEWDLGYSQRDHVTFRATPSIERMAERNEVLAKLARAAEVLMAAAGDDAPEWDVSIQEHGTWVSYHTRPADHAAECLLGQIADAMQDEVYRIVGNACREMKQLGYAEIEYKDSDEYLDELLTANDQYLFDEDGELDDE
jgi:hypothetical protein